MNIKNMIRRHTEIKGYKLVMDYPGSRRPLGTFEPYTSGDFSKYPQIWKTVYYKDVIRDKKLTDLGI